MSKIENFLNQLSRWQKQINEKPLDELIWKIYNDTGYYNYVSLMPDGILRQANLKMLFERAKQCESISFKGLFNFINYIEKIKTSSKDMDSAKVIGENDDVIEMISSLLFRSMQHQRLSEVKEKIQSRSKKIKKLSLYFTR